MLRFILVLVLCIQLIGCAGVVLTPVTAVAVAAEHKTGRSPVSSFLSAVSGSDCDLKRLLIAV